MWRFIKAAALASVLGGGACEVFAFTLLGPSAAWMTPSIGYGDPNPDPDVGGGTGGSVGGPMNLGEEFRWNIPTVYYAFSPSFKEYFGARGIEEVEKAIKILNDLPSMDSLNVNDYPLSSQRMNYQAQALGLLDVKSFMLSYLVHVLGITDPTRYVFTVRNRFIVAQTTNYFIIKRNFDPVTWEPSSYINEQLWTYTTILDSQDLPSTLTANETVDPLALQGLIHAPVTSGWFSGLLQFGGFWTGLTRDDVGGLKYIYRTDNYNMEVAPPTAARAGFGAVASGGGSSPWSYPVITPPTGTTPGGGAVVNPATNFVITAVRPGVGKVEFVRLDFDSQVGFFVSNTVAYTDTVITNGRSISQDLVRPLAFPDILFDAGDLQGGDSDDAFLGVLHTENAAGWLTNGLPEVAAQQARLGPGIIPPSDLTASSFVITLNNVGPTLLNFTPFALSEALATRVFRWGSFDGTTNAPVIYPSGASIREIEEQVLGGGGGGGGGAAGFVDTWTPAASVLLPVGTNLGGGTGAGGTGGGGTTTP